MAAEDDDERPTNRDRSSDVEDFNAKTSELNDEGSVNGNDSSCDGSFHSTHEPNQDDDRMVDATAAEAAANDVEAIGDVSGSPDLEQSEATDDIDHSNGSDEQHVLHKSTRFRGYMTLTLASFIHYDTAENSSGENIVHVSVVPGTPEQRRYAVAVALVSLLIAAACLVVHLDRITPLRRIWSIAFGPGSRWECALLVFLTIWWTVATGVHTSISGIAGDGRGQFSLYYSSWVCCFTCYWMLERWLVAAGVCAFHPIAISPLTSLFIALQWSSLKSFIKSWPNRSPIWICTAVLSMATFVWYLDLWRNHTKLVREEEQLIVQHLGRVSGSQWRWLVFIVIATFIPSIIFSLAELVRGSNPDGTITKKTYTETVIEGVAFFVLTIAWIPTVMMATTPRGAASLIGNSYFFTWAVAIVVVEGFIWFIHDKRQEAYQALTRKQQEYRRRQDRVEAQTNAIIAKGEEEECADVQQRDRTVSFDMGAFRSAFAF